MLILLVFVNIVNICPYSTLSAQVVWSILLSSISSSFMFLLNSPRNWGAQRCQDFDSGIREILSKFQTNMAILQLFDFANFVRHFSHYIFCCTSPFENKKLNIASGKRLSITIYSLKKIIKVEKLGYHLESFTHFRFHCRSLSLSRLGYHLGSFTHFHFHCRSLSLSRLPSTISTRSHSVWSATSANTIRKFWRYSSLKWEEPLPIII